MITQTQGREIHGISRLTRWIPMLTCGGMLAFLSACGPEQNIVIRACEEGSTRQISCEDKSRVLAQQCMQGAWMDLGDACPLPPACQEGATETLLCASDDQLRTRTCRDGVWIASACVPRTHTPAPVNECTEGQALDVLCEGGELQHHTCVQDRWNPPLDCAQECPYDDRQEAPCGINDRGRRTQRCNAGTWEGTWLCLDPDECRDGDQIAEASCGGWVGNWAGECEEGQWVRTPCKSISLRGSGGPVDASHPGFCALDTSGVPYCWGANQAGQLGREHREADAYIAPVHTQVPFQQIAYGSNHSCGVSTQGEVFCWGDNSDRVVSRASNDVMLSPQLHEDQRTVQEVVVGPHNACAITTDNLLWCWGKNSVGQLGAPTQFLSHTMFRIEPLAGVSGVSIGQDTLCAIANNGKVWCWGDNNHSLILDEDALTTAVPRQIEGLSLIRHIAMSSSHVCAARQQYVYCWGANHWGQSGVEGPVKVHEPITITLPADVVKIAVGNALSCAVTTEHQLYCWGSNQAHEIDGSSDAPDFFASPTRITHQPYFADIAISSSSDAPALHTLCAATQGGRVACWGHPQDFSIPVEELDHAQRAPVFVTPH